MVATVFFAKSNRIFYSKLHPNRNGWETHTTCVKWSSDSGNWSQSHTLRQKRYGHVSWATAAGVYLMGGSGSSSRKTTELVKADGSVEDGFSLIYDTL